VGDRIDVPLELADFEVTDFEVTGSEVVNGISKSLSSPPSDPLVVTVDRSRWAATVATSALSGTAHVVIRRS
jgi:hypothetical protein